MSVAQVIQFPDRGYDPLLTKLDVAERLRMSARTVERYCNPNYCSKRGVPLLPHFTNPSGQLRFRLSEVDRWNEGKVA